MFFFHRRSTILYLIDKREKFLKKIFPPPSPNKKGMQCMYLSMKSMNPLHCFLYTQMLYSFSPVCSVKPVLGPGSHQKTHWLVDQLKKEWACRLLNLKEYGNFTFNNRFVKPLSVVPKLFWAGHSRNSIFKKLSPLLSVLRSRSRWSQNVLVPGAGAEDKIKKFSAVSLEDASMKKS